MVLMTVLKKLNVSQVTAELNRPFAMVNLAFVGDIAVSVYVCQGMLNWHRHLDNDELFWVHGGTMLLESEWGEVRLRPGELAVVPKGVAHRSGSELRTTVLLLHCGVAPERKNGKRRLYSIGDEAKLRRINLQGAMRGVIWPFQFQTVARIDDSAVQVAWGEGAWSVEMPAPHDLLIFVLRGTATVRTSQSMMHLHPGDFTVVPHGALYQLSTSRDTALVRVTREGVKREME